MLYTLLFTEFFLVIQQSFEFQPGERGKFSSYKIKYKIKYKTNHWVRVFQSVINKFRHKCMYIHI